ncbi:hypothetical protein TMatcc_003613 [Talaromyces marneffei ATCC 18224]
MLTSKLPMNHTPTKTLKRPAATVRGLRSPAVKGCESLASSDRLSTLRVNAVRPIVSIYVRCFEMLDWIYDESGRPFGASPSKISYLTSVAPSGRTTRTTT